MTEHCGVVAGSPSRNLGAPLVVCCWSLFRATGRGSGAELVFPLELGGPNRSRPEPEYQWYRATRACIRRGAQLLLNQVAADGISSMR